MGERENTDSAKTTFDPKQWRNEIKRESAQIHLTRREGWDVSGGDYGGRVRGRSAHSTWWHEMDDERDERRGRLIGNRERFFSS